MDATHAGSMDVARWGERLRYVCTLGVFGCAIILGVLVAGGFHTPEQSFAAALYTLVFATGSSTNVTDLSFNSTRIIGDEAMQALLWVLPEVKVAKIDSPRSSILEGCYAVSTFLFTLPLFYSVCNARDRCAGPYKDRKSRYVVASILGLVAGLLVFSLPWSYLFCVGGVADPYTFLMHDHLATVFFFGTLGTSLGALIGQAWPEDRGPVPRLGYEDEVTRLGGILTLLTSTALLFFVIMGVGTNRGQRTAAALVDIRRLVGSEKYPGPVALNYTGNFLGLEAFKTIESDVLPNLPKHVDAMESATPYVLFVVALSIATLGAILLASTAPNKQRVSPTSSRRVANEYSWRRKCCAFGFCIGLSTALFVFLSTPITNEPAIALLFIGLTTFCTLIGTASPERRGTDFRRPTDVEARPTNPSSDRTGRSPREEIELQGISRPTEASAPEPQNTDPAADKTTIESASAETTEIATPSSSVSGPSPRPNPTGTEEQSPPSYQAPHSVHRERAPSSLPTPSLPTTPSRPRPAAYTTHSYRTQFPGEHITTSWIEDVATVEADLGERWVHVGEGYEGRWYTPPEYGEEIRVREGRGRRQF